MDFMVHTYILTYIYHLDLYKMYILGKGITFLSEFDLTCYHTNCFEVSSPLFNHCIQLWYWQRKVVLVVVIINKVTVVDTEFITRKNTGID